MPLRQFAARKRGPATLVLASALYLTTGAWAASVPNGGFEEGGKGWMWEQWNGRPLPGEFDKGDHREGAASFKMGLPGVEGARYLGKEIQIEDAGQDRVLKFWLKMEGVPERAARVALAVPGRGFVHGGDLVRTGGTEDWKEYRYPIPASALAGASKVTAFFYHDRIGSGRIGIDGLSFEPGTLGADEASPVAAAVPAGPVGKAIVLRGDTSKPETSTFAPGEEPKLTFRVSDLTPGAAPLKLQLSIVDEHDQPVESKEIPVEADEAGQWETTIPAPAPKLGFYRVQARLSNGVPLQGSGSRKPGFITYAVVPDPAQRKDYGEKDSHFGMQGGFGPWGDDVLACLGARWVLDGSLEWKKKEPDKAGQFDAGAALADLASKPAGEVPWKKYSLPTLFAAPRWAVVPETFSYMTGTLTPAGEKAWDAYCRKAARVYMAKNPDREERVYQITWEPIRPWGFKGTDEALVKIYQIAHKALHETDPKAVVAGPTQGVKERAISLLLFKAGLFKFIDAFSVHPYYPIPPEREGMVESLRSLKDAIDHYAGKPLPMFGTEQGASTEEDPAQDLSQARGLMRENLITLGEGYRVNFAFYISDYRLAGQKGYGYYYTLDDSIPFGPKKISPRPIVPAYAAQSLLLDGHDAAGAVEWLGETAWGYAFEREGKAVLALWDYGSDSSQVSIPTGGAGDIKVYDWMGNPLPAAAADGVLSLELGPEPVYVTGLSAELWGRASSQRLAAEQAEAYPGVPASVRVAVRAPAGEPFTGDLVVTADKRLGMGPVTKRVSLKPGGSDRFDVPVDVPAGAQPGRYPVQLLLENAEGEAVAVSGFGLEVARPISIVGVEPMARSQGHGVEVVLKNDRPAPISGNLEFEFRYTNGTQQNVPFDIDGGSVGRVEVIYPDSFQLLPATVYQARVSVATTDGYITEKTVLANFFTAPRLDTRPGIDGDPEDWAGVPAAALSGKWHLARESKSDPYTGGPDLSAKLRYAWDDEALYVLAEVTDDHFSQEQAGADIWRGDSLQLAFNLDPDKKQERTGNLLADAANRQRSSEIAVALTKSGVEAIRLKSFDPEILAPGPLSKDQITAVVNRAEGSMIYEIAIPWTTLGRTPGEAAPASRDRIGIAAAINDADSAEETAPDALGLYRGVSHTPGGSSPGILTLGDPF